MYQYFIQFVGLCKIKFKVQKVAVDQDLAGIITGNNAKWLSCFSLFINIDDVPKLINLGLKYFDAKKRPYTVPF